MTAAGVQTYNVNRWWLAAIVLILVLCIVVIVISPYVDLPLTTVRACITAVLFAQGLLLGGTLNQLTLSLAATRAHPPSAFGAEGRSGIQLRHLLCAYLC
jgi:hypothetical protein